MNNQNILDALINHTRLLIYFKDTGGRYTFVNREWLARCRLERDQVIGRNDIELFGEVWGENFRINDRKVAETREPFEFEESVTLPDGRVIVHHSVKFPVFDQEGRLCGTGGMSSDISERKQLEASLLLSNRTKDKFFSIIAHDLKNPLNGLLGLTDLLLDDLPYTRPDQLEKEIRLIGQTTRVLYNLLDNLLAWARSQTGQLECRPVPCTLAGLCREASDTLVAALGAKSLRLETEIPTDLRVLADPHLTSAILRNLLSNAVKYSHPGGEIRISARADGDQVLLEIEDAGVGISPQRIARLFQPEAKSSTPGTGGELGTGLGLLLCKDFAERQSGRIEAESLPGQGACFRLFLPVAPAGAQRPHPAQTGNNLEAASR